MDVISASPKVLLSNIDTPSMESVENMSVVLSATGKPDTGLLNLVSSVSSWVKKSSPRVRGLSTGALRTLRSKGIPPGRDGTGVMPPTTEGCVT